MNCKNYNPYYYDCERCNPEVHPLCNLYEKPPAPPLPIRAPGHGQGTEEERVERVTRAIRETQWANMRDDEFARILLAAADAVPGPEVEWTTEAPKETDTWWWVQIETLTPQIVFYIASDTVLKSGDERPHHVHEFSRWWPVPISEPPRGGTK